MTSLSPESQYNRELTEHFHVLHTDSISHPRVIDAHRFIELENDFHWHFLLMEMIDKAPELIVFIHSMHVTPF